MVPHLHPPIRCSIALCAWFIQLNVALQPSLAQVDETFFENTIRPILVDHCQDCHSVDDAAGGLQLDTRQGWERGGESGPAIVPSDPTASLLIRAVRYKDEVLQMPPAEAGGQLEPDQIAALETWIRRGAVDPRDGSPITTDIDLAAKDHWAFQPLAQVPIPANQHPIDFLIGRNLLDQGLRPTETASMPVLVRRASYDLHGLPPSPGQLKTPREGFPDLIDQLLAAPQYGERWGRHWLDVARYSDAKDGVLMYGDARIRPFAYTYRDYVIQAFNEDKPFDQFIREQLAADQLELEPHADDLAAMGLLTLGRMFDRNRHDVIDDQIDVITRGFLGLTVSCARCHDHKFDPVPTADYYSLYGVLASSREPLERPRVEPISQAGQAFEDEFAKKLAEVRAVQQGHYRDVLETARERTPDYLVAVATTEPDIAETSVFFLSLIPEQLRPHITYRWRQLIARRAFPEDPLFGPWYDMMREPVLREQEWRDRGIDSRIIEGLVAAKPTTPAGVAQTYGEIIRGNWSRRRALESELKTVKTRLALLDESSINLADIVGGGDGTGTGTKGVGIHPATGRPTTGQTSFVAIEEFDQLVPVTENPFVDGVFTPKGETAVISSTGVRAEGIPPSSGQSWDYYKNGAGNGFTTTSIEGIDFDTAPNWMLYIHANKGITFDIDALRTAHHFSSSRFRGLLGNLGAQGQSQLDVCIYLDGNKVVEERNIAAQEGGRPVDLAIPENARFLTLVITEGAQGISHDQAVIGNPRIVPDQNQDFSSLTQSIKDELQARANEIEAAIEAFDVDTSDPLTALLISEASPVWFPVDELSHYLSRQKNDAFRGLVGQLDAIGVKHQAAAGRAMILRDADRLHHPAIFVRGDPSQRGKPVPRQFLKVLSGDLRKPFANGSGRLELANQIASAENPLTARVWVNRIWMHHFGEPLVENPSDFGLRTSQPVQHELLDFLATYLIEQGWRTKPLHRLIMTSEAWQRSSLIPQETPFLTQLQEDPENRMLWRANRRRLDLEQMRDSLLHVVGQLDPTMFGRPKLITDPSNKRRTVYAFVERQNVPNLVTTFDFANPDTSTARRISTTVPQQALFGMNSTFMAEAARALIERLPDGDATGRVNQLYTLVYGRAASDDELELATTFLNDGTWEMLAQVLLISNEFMFVD